MLTLLRIWYEEILLRFWSYDGRELKEIILNLVEREGAEVFMTGGMGDFDATFSSAVRAY